MRIVFGLVLMWRKMICLVEWVEVDVACWCWWLLMLTCDGLMRLLLGYALEVGVKLLYGAGL